MTINPLWAAYNNIHNEGGEGFNPHAKHIQTGGEPLWSKLDDEAARLLRILNGTSESDSRFAELTAKRAEVLAALVIARREDI